MPTIAGLASNHGRNLLHIADQSPGDATIGVIVTNDADAPVLDAASARGIPTAVIERPDEQSRENHERRILDTLAQHDIDIICLDGYMRVLTETFIESTPPVLNVHPSLLPAFPGLHTHERVLEADVRITGCTVHLVTEAVDEGPIITQESVPVRTDDDVSTLKKRVRTKAEFVAYPRTIRLFSNDNIAIDGSETPPSVSVDGDDNDQLPEERHVSSNRIDTLRYGENPHQAAAVYGDMGSAEPSVVRAPQLNKGAKALSYNNYNDADAALRLVQEFEEPTAAVIKHTNPAGCATAETLADAYADALATDPMSAFGGIVALNRECDDTTAKAIIDSFKEVVVAPGYTDSAIEFLKEREDLRVLEIDSMSDSQETHQQRSTISKPLIGGRLVQEQDTWAPSRDDLEVVTSVEPTEEQLITMEFAWRVLKHVKSNGIVLADGTETRGIGMGQVSRVDAVRLAVMKATEHAENGGPAGSVMASDAFFPFPDGVETAAEADIEAVIQPGGSVNDDQVIAACEEQGIPMVFTGRRCFKHD
ncbi:phosphoribosylglycinamide formyltransferase [Haloquadratum walsbyi]|jgi:phosphoribosylglycinamide formyltransferase, formyltetrahydrofolate-dependent|uniref:phosphoribosylglycinamide formyltransferase 1 n=1 Tax=Haloquadratum walsbyi J07HQW2 TaxID=1238425 RepID=U1N1F7_9EURY|nr:phosphoribosylglycinamide formyltransferase [Haloquadratum walsbyi]ERG96684.1 MAG: phosphoribosylglycinamide formyltransferase, formyltetrahydrofolate-dependent [Haloquadratum walsbyi J07HQW2]